ncbi:VanZ family protein [Bacillus sp. 31A1R]|uniref:VanZ family protein n=1 Tax=Robertmurraya mangrovi TaxID=3098077 RepID=A0ABU5IXE8_9BACI|nr:VanZ family protein [Bacillus sp. 31A1R]MDZ5471833.1 VanZ family protein [Bacillus sp. 31A1R]
MKIIFKWTLRLLPIAYMIVIWVLSGLPHNAVVELPDSTIDRFFKESMHLVEFAILYLLLILAALTTNTFNAEISLVCAVIAALYGVVDEIHQSFVPYRSATFIDVFKDALGVLISYWFIQKGYFEGKSQKLVSLLNKIPK